MKKYERTPGTWKVDYTSIRTDKGLLIGTTQIIQNAEFICMAVNNHDKLVELLKKAEQTIIQLASELNYKSGRWAGEHVHPITKALASIENGGTT